MSREGLGQQLGSGGHAGVRSNFVSSPPGTAKSAAFILVVEDEVLVRMMVSDSLRDAGYQVIEAINADEAISVLKSGARIDLMLTDVRMPGSMDGLGLLEYCRDVFPALPVIITSGHLLPHDALTKGAADFLGKPYSFDYAITVVEREIAKSR